MKGFLQGVLFFVVSLAVILGIVWMIQGADFFLYRYFAPKYEQARRETYEQSKAYRQGEALEVENLLFQYETADAAHKDALASLLLHETADLDESTLPPDVAAKLDQLRAQRLNP